MENLLYLFATTLLATIRPKVFRNRPIANTGCSIKMLDQQPFHLSQTNTGDEMYFGECSDGRSSYGMLLIKFRETKPASQWKQMLTEFTDSLHPSFGIEHTTSHEWNYWHPNSPYAVGYVEYGQDKKGNDWKISAWIDGHSMVVSYVSNIAESTSKKQEEFLSSFRFAKH